MVSAGTLQSGEVIWLCRYSISLTMPSRFASLCRSAKIMLLLELNFRRKYSMFCMKCGTKLPDDAVFCFKCGAKVSVGDTNNISNEGASQTKDNREANYFSPFGGIQNQQQAFMDFDSAVYDIHTDVELTEDEAFKGVEKAVSFVREVMCDHCNGYGVEPNNDCPDCHGAGFVQGMTGSLPINERCPKCAMINEPCHKCNGTLRLKKKTDLRVKVPSGVYEGERLRIKELGNVGNSGIYKGDLYIHIHIKAPYEIKNDDAYFTLNITSVDAKYGKVAEVKGPAGRQLIRIPAGIESGTIAKLAGKGLPRLDRSGSGDLYVTINVSDDNENVIKPVVKEPTPSWKEKQSTNKPDNLSSSINYNNLDGLGEEESDDFEEMFDSADDTLSSYAGGNVDTYGDIEDVIGKLVSVSNDLSTSTLLLSGNSVGICDYENEKCYLMSYSKFHSKASNILDSYAKDTGLSDTEIRFILDASVLGSATDGFIITDKFIIGSSNKRLIPLNQVECLSYDKNIVELKIFVEPAHSLLAVMTNQGYYVEVIEKLNKHVFEATNNKHHSVSYGMTLNNGSSLGNWSEYEVDQRFALLRQAFDNSFWDRHSRTISVLDLVSEKKASNIVGSYAKDSGIQARDIKVLIDNTLFGSAKEGLALTNRFIIGSEGKRLIPLEQIQYISVEKDESSTFTYNIVAEPLRNHIVSMTLSDDYIEFFKKMNEIVFNHK